MSKKFNFNFWRHLGKKTRQTKPQTKRRFTFETLEDRRLLSATITQWTFENLSTGTNNTPAASTGSGTADAIGMATYATPNIGVNKDDVVAGVAADTGANTQADLSHVWRIRGQAGSNGAANGWSSAAPIGAQGTQFFASTTGNGSITVSFDWYATSAGEANLQLAYTADGGTTWTNAPITLGAHDAGLTVLTNTISSNTVMGSYVSDNSINNGSSAGQDWFPGLTATLPAAAANSPGFGIELVNASTGADCVNTGGTPLNNTSGNWRFDNVTISGTVLSAANAPTVDTPTATSITNTSAVLGGTVESNTGAAITDAGVYYALTSQNSNPQMGGANVTKVDFGPINGSLPFAFTVPVTGLTSGAGYTFEAFATNSSGTTYTSPTSFTTLGAPTVNSPTIAAVTGSSATLGGNVASDGGAMVTGRGVIFAPTSDGIDPKIDPSAMTATSSGTTGVFTVPVTGLSGSTSYTFEAFATNTNGTNYSAATSFTTAVPGVITSWTFPALAGAGDNSPAPTYGTGTATTLGMTNSYNGGNTAADDVIVTAGTLDPSFSENTWRVRGSGHNGWATYQNGAGAPQYSQGAELDTSTVGYSNIVFSFDWYSTTQGIRDLQVQYNTGSGWVNYQGPSPTGTFIANSNDYYNSTLSPVNPTIYVNLSGVAAANNISNLGIRLVSAFDSTATLGNEYASAATDASGDIVPYNNSSGNWRFDNLTFQAGITTTTAVTANPPVGQSPNQPVTFTATVTPASGAHYASGTVKFYDGNNQIGTTQNVMQVGSTNVGTASITLSTLAPGVHGNITAQYTPALGNGLIASGSSMNLVAGDPTDNPISYTINAPQATGVDVSPVVNQSFTGVVATFSDGTFTDPTGFSASINWGNGNSSSGTIQFTGTKNETNINGQVVPVSLYTVTGTNTYANTGSYPLSITITDPNNNTATVTPTARVAYAPLTVTAAMPLNTTFGTSFTNQTAATFTDPGIVALGLADPTTQFTASIDWGDGTMANPDVTAGAIIYSAGTFSVVGSHNYAQVGSYSISVSITPLTLSVERIDSSDPTNLNLVGDENGNHLTDAPSADFIDQFAIGVVNQSSALYTTSLPTVATVGSSEALTNSSYSVSEGNMTLSTDGKYLVTGGYNATVSAWAPQQTFSPASVINRVIGTVDGNSNINTTTALTDAYSGDNFRGVASTDGTQFWTSGHATANDGFVHYAQLGATTSTIVTGANSTPYNPSNINTIEIFNGQLYEGVRSTSGSPAGIFQIGTGLPTTAGASGQSETMFIQVPQSNPLDLDATGKPMSPFAFWMTDLNDGNPDINGVNVAYVADAEMGIARYDHLASGWQFNYYINSTGSFKDSVFSVDVNGNVTATASFNSTNPIPASDPNADTSKAGGVKGLTGRVVNGQVQLFAVTGFGTGAQPNPGGKVIEVTDTGAGAGFTTLAINPTTDPSELTGVAFSPTAVVTTSAQVNKAATSTVVVSFANPLVYGQAVTFTATVSNISGTGAVPTGTAQFIVDGSNFGAPVAVDATGHAVSLPDTFLSGATHTVKVIYNNIDGNFIGGNSPILTQTVQTVAREADPRNPALTDLFVGGTSASDHIEVKLNNGQITVDMHDGNTPTITPLAGLSALVVYGQANNEHIQVDNSLMLPAFLFGGNGANVHIEGGGGPTVEVGGTGAHNHLQGGSGRNILIAGQGGGHLEGNNSDDILIGGTTNFDHNLVALEAIMAEWNSGETYLQRIANLQNAPMTSGVQTVIPNGSYVGGYYLNASTVHDDGVSDHLEGKGGLDWYFANLGKPNQDNTDVHNGEISVDIS